MKRSDVVGENLKRYVNMLNKRFKPNQRFIKPVGYERSVKNFLSSSSSSFSLFAFVRLFRLLTSIFGGGLIRFFGFGSFLFRVFWRNFSALLGFRFFIRALVIGDSFFGGSWFLISSTTCTKTYLWVPWVISVSSSLSLNSSSFTIPLTLPFDEIFRLQVSNLKSRNGINTNFVALSMRSKL